MRSHLKRCPRGDLITDPWQIPQFLGGHAEIVSEDPLWVEIRSCRSCRSRLPRLCVEYWLQSLGWSPTAEAGRAGAAGLRSCPCEGVVRRAVPAGHIVSALPALLSRGRYSSGFRGPVWFAGMARLIVRTKGVVRLPVVLRISAAWFPKTVSKFCAVLCLWVGSRVVSVLAAGSPLAMVSLAGWALETTESGRKRRRARCGIGRS